MRRHPVEDDANSGGMGRIDEAGQALRPAEPGGGANMPIGW
jgi:hypothetical protein